MLLTEYNETETMELFKEEGREEERSIAEGKDRHRVWKMYEKGRTVYEIADDMELSPETVERWISAR